MWRPTKPSSKADQEEKQISNLIRRESAASCVGLECAKWRHGAVRKGEKGREMAAGGTSVVLKTIGCVAKGAVPT